jgi:hypothetical protein
MTRFARVFPAGSALKLDYPRTANAWTTTVKNDSAGRRARFVFFERKELAALRESSVSTLLLGPWLTPCHF